MSFLTPLYVLGGMAIALPILFHLIRRRPKESQLFSSHLFLKPTPPRLTKRSRLDQLPLLLLRILAILGLAFAFARPFIRDAELAVEAAPGKRIAILIDTSASMSRQGIWAPALTAARSALQAATPSDQVTLISFDQQPTVIASTNPVSKFAQDQDQPQLTNSDLVKLLDNLRPTMAPGDLGQAVIFAADLLSKGDGSELDADNERRTKQLVIVSDFQRGSDEPMRALQAYPWPKDVAVKLNTISPQDPSNAFAEVLGDKLSISNDPAEKSDNPTQHSIRVRVSNSNESKQHNFTVGWAGANGELSSATALPVQVPPGTARIVSLPYPAKENQEFATFVLNGDGEAFDNVRYVATAPMQSFKLLFVSDSKSKPEQSAAFYLSKIPLDDVRWKAEVQIVTSSKLPPSVDPKQTPLVIVQNEVAPQALSVITEYAKRGGHVFWTLDSEAQPSLVTPQLQQLFEHEPLQLTLVNDQDYTMWSKIDFTSPLFAPFADPRFNDFTKIRFWKHWKASSLPTHFQTLTEYEDQTPAFIEASMGTGKIWLLTAGWQPTESQLSLSTKFVPLISRLFTSTIPWLDSPQNFTVGDAPDDILSQGQRLLDSSRKEVATLRSPKDWDTIAKPGFYYLADEHSERAIALNIATSESFTETLGEDEWERLGVQLKPLQDDVNELSSQRQKRDVELEQNQGFWQWFVLAVIAILAMEGLWRGVVDRSQTVAEA